MRFPSKFLLRPQVFLALIACAGVALAFLSTVTYGSGLSPDSITYIGTARNIAHGAGVVTYDGTPLILMPPLYPFLLAVIERLLGADPVSSAPILNAILFGLILYMAGYLVLKYGSKPVALATTVFLLFSPALIIVCLMAWSEPLLIAFVLLFLITLQKYRESSGDSWLLLLAVSVTLASFTRYIGIILIPVALICIFLNQKGRLIALGRQMLTFLAVSGLPIFAWLIRNHSISGAFFGVRPASHSTILENVTHTFDVVLKWFFPMVIVQDRPLLIILVLTFVTIIILFPDRKLLTKKSIRDMAPIFLLAAFYTGFLIVSSSVVAYDQIDTRLLSPIYIPIVVLVVFLVSRVSLFNLPPKDRNILISMVILAFTVLQAQASVPQALQRREEGYGYSSIVWSNSELLQYAASQELPSECTTIYTNDPYLFYIAANKITRMPLISAGKSADERVAYLAQVKGVWPAEDNACLVWANNSNQSYNFYTVNEMQQVVTVKELNSFPDGTIYSLARMSPAV